MFHQTKLIGGAEARTTVISPEDLHKPPYTTRVSGDEVRNKQLKRGGCLRGRMGGMCFVEDEDVDRSRR